VTLAGIPKHFRRLQSVVDAAARLTYLSSRFDHFTPLLRQFHLPKAKERIDFKLAVLLFKCVHGSAPIYLVDELSRPADSLARCRLRSASSSILVVRRTRLTAVGDQSFPVTASRVWNNLPQHVTFRCVTCMEQSSTSRHLPMCHVHDTIFHSTTFRCVTCMTQSSTARHLPMCRVYDTIFHSPSPSDVSRVWNNLPHHVTFRCVTCMEQSSTARHLPMCHVYGTIFHSTSPSLRGFKNRLKTHLCSSFP